MIRRAAWAAVDAIILVVFDLFAWALNHYQLKEPW